jgi:cell division protein FtsN
MLNDPENTMPDRMMVGLKYVMYGVWGVIVILVVAGLLSSLNSAHTHTPHEITLATPQAPVITVADPDKPIMAAVDPPHAPMVYSTPVTAVTPPSPAPVETKDEVVNDDGPYRSANEWEKKSINGKSFKEPEKSTPTVKAVAPVTSEPAASVIMPKKPVPVAGSSTGEWRVRFAVCNLLESCEVLKGELAAEGIASEVVSYPDNSMTYQAKVGPFGDRQRTQRARHDLEIKGIILADVIIGSLFYLVSSETSDQEGVKLVVTKTIEAGYPASLVPSPHGKITYKLFGIDSYSSRSATEASIKQIRKRGIRCIAEQR